MSTSKIISINEKKELLNSDDNQKIIFNVLKNTLYPTATDEEAYMILEYCKVKQYNPILKPVHLVPMKVKTDKKNEKGKFIYEEKNVIMPGIGSYRIDASRSGQYAGLSEPIFGEDVTETFHTTDFNNKSITKSITYPKWCKMIVKKRLHDGSIAEFPVIEYWKENYATKSAYENCPNNMWEKRPYGQLAKCAEAQALRKAFPDIVGNEYTHEEMEGKIFEEINNQTKKITEEKPILVEEVKIIEPEIMMEDDIKQMEIDISQSVSLNELETTFKKHYKKVVSQKDQYALKRLIKAKDERKAAISDELIQGFNDELNSNTNEVAQ